MTGQRSYCIDSHMPALERSGDAEIKYLDVYVILYHLLRNGAK